MLRHYLRTGLRVLAKNKLINTINIICLAIGMIVSLTIGSYCSSEYRYDQFNVNVDRIYQLWATVQYGGEQLMMDRFSAGTAAAIQQRFAGVEAAARVIPKSEARIGKLGDKSTMPARLIYTDPDLFNIFSFEPLKGNFDALSASNKAFISESLARRLFSNSIDVLGKTLIYKDTIPLEVVGIMQDVPLRSSIKFDIAVSFATLERMPGFKDAPLASDIALGEVKTYLLLEGDKTSRNLPSLLSAREQVFEIKALHLEALRGAHVRNYGGERDSNLSVLIAISILILVVVVINSINITSSLQIGRSKEMVIRKIIGSSRSAVITQFYVESLLVSFFSLTIALLGTYLAMGPISTLLSLSVDFSYLLVYPFPIIAGVVFVLIVFAGGLYPALVLSGSNPLSTISGGFERSAFARYSRRVSLLLQFTASFILVVAASLLSNQLEFARATASRVELDDIIVVQLDPTQAKSYQMIRNQLMSVPGVEQIGTSDMCLFEMLPSIVVTTKDTTNQVALELLNCDVNFIRLMNLEMVLDTVSSSGMLVNDVARRALFGSNNPLGRYVTVSGNQLMIRGTIRDFHYQGLKNRIGNLGMAVATDWVPLIGQSGCTMYIKFASPAARIRHAPLIQKQLSSLFPEEIWENTSLSDVYERSTAAENDIFSALSFLSVLAVVLAAFGIIGQLLFQIQSKTSEISIRKVLGANLLNIGHSICFDMLLILIVSIFVSIPVALRFVSQWTESFAYKTTISGLSIMISIGVIASIIVVTMTIFVRRAFALNIAKHLRSE